MKLTATKELRYAGENLKPGDEFEAGERDGKLLKAIGKATDALEPEKADDPAPKPEQKPEYKTRRLKAKD